MDNFTHAFNFIHLEVIYFIGNLHLQRILFPLYLFIEYTNEVIRIYVQILTVS